MAAAMAALPWTTACSPKTISLPGAETMNGGAIGVEDFRVVEVIFVGCLLAGWMVFGEQLSCP